MQPKGLLNYRLKFCWLKGICCICHSNEFEREIKHKTGGSSRGPAKNLEGAWPEPYQPHSIPPIGGPRCHSDPKFSSVAAYSPKESLDPPNWNMKR